MHRIASSFKLPPLHLNTCPYILRALAIVQGARRPGRGTYPAAAKALREEASDSALSSRTDASGMMHRSFLSVNEL